MNNESKNKIGMWILPAGTSDIADESWEIFKKESYFGIGSYGNKNIDFRKFHSEDELKSNISDYKYYDPFAILKFVNNFNIGDLIIVRRGLNELAGMGFIKSDFIPQTENKIKNNLGLNNIRCVKWFFTPDDLYIRKNFFSNRPLVDLLDHPLKWNKLLCLISRGDKKLKKEILEFLYSEFFNEFLNNDEGKNYLKNFDKQSESIKNTWIEISDKKSNNELIPDELWDRLFDFNVNVWKGKDISFKSVLNSSKYSDDKIIQSRDKIVEVINSILNAKDINLQKSILKEYSTVKSSEIFDVALLSHILHCIDNSFYIIDDNTNFTINLLSMMFGEEELLDWNLNHYLDNNIKFKKFLNKLNDVYQYSNLDIPDFRIFYTFCHWMSNEKLGHFVAVNQYVDRKVNILPIKLLGEVDDTMEKRNYDKLNISPELLESKLQGFAINENSINQLCASLNAGKHIILDGTPGTGKTDLAIKFSKVASENNFIDGFILTTATSDWSTFDTIGGLMPENDGSLHFHQGKFLEAIAENKWLIIDEINRADIDKAFGQLFTVLSGQHVELPYKINDNPIKIKIWNENFCKFDYENATYNIGKNWRIIGTMNVDDKDSLFDLSYAFMRRFMFIEIDLPQKDEFINLIELWANDLDDYYSRMLVNLYDLVNYRKLGPAIFKDMIDYIKFRNELDSTNKELILAESISSYIIPQFEGLNKAKLDRINKFFDELGLLDYLQEQLDELLPNF